MGGEIVIIEDCVIKYCCVHIYNIYSYLRFRCKKPKVISKLRIMFSPRSQS